MRTYLFSEYNFEKVFRNGKFKLIEFTTLCHVSALVFFFPIFFCLYVTPLYGMYICFLNLRCYIALCNIVLCWWCFYERRILEGIKVAFISRNDVY